MQTMDSLKNHYSECMHMFIALSCTWRKVKVLCSGNMYKLMTVYISDQHINIPNFRCHSTSNTKAITLRDRVENGR